MSTDQTKSPSPPPATSANTAKPPSPPATSASAAKSSPKPNLLWIGLATLILVGLVTIALASRNNQKDSQANAVGSPGQFAGTKATVQPTPAPSGAFTEAADTWSGIEEARKDLDDAIQGQRMGDVHRATGRIRELMAVLPRQSAALSEEKRDRLETHVRNVDQLVTMLDQACAANNMKSAREHRAAMDDAMNMIEGLFPEREFGEHGAMRGRNMHMPRGQGMGPRGPGMGNDAMSGSDGAATPIGANGSSTEAPPMSGTMPNPDTAAKGSAAPPKKQPGGMPGNAPGGMGGMSDDGMSGSGMAGKSGGGMGHMGIRQRFVHFTATRVFAFIPINRR